MPKDMTAVTGWVPRQVKEELEELLVDDESLSEAVGAAVRTEIKLRRRAIREFEEGQRQDPKEEGVSRETP